MKQRWYESYDDLNELLAFIQSLEEEDREVVASHLLQIVLSECCIDLDKEFSKISENNYSYNRWYDQNIDISTSMELIKNLPDNKKNYVVKRFLTEIVMSYAKKEL